MIINLKESLRRTDCNATTIIDLACEYGAGGVDLPVYRTDRVVSRLHAPDMADDLLSREFNREQLLQLSEYIRDCDLNVYTTPYDLNSLSWVERKIDPDSHITAPGDLTYKRLLENLARIDRPLLLRTEVAPEKEIKQALEWVEESSVTLMTGIPAAINTSKSFPQNHVKTLHETFEHEVGLSLFRNNFLKMKDASKIQYVLSEISEDGNSQNQFRINFSTEQSNLSPTSSDHETSEDIPPGDSLDTNENLVTRYRKEYRRSLMAEESISAGSTLSRKMVRELRPAGGLPASKIDQCTGMLIPRPTDPQEMIAYS